eukprot:4252393-Lingulodinium_polyedra.AAC.1
MIQETRWDAPVAATWKDRGNGGTPGSTRGRAVRGRYRLPGAAADLGASHPRPGLRRGSVDRVGV